MEHAVDMLLHIREQANYLVSLNPTYIPAIPPTAERNIEEKENVLPPQISGRYPPANKPIVIVRYISFFESIWIY
jgi:hypothetical protein